MTLDLDLISLGIPQSKAAIPQLLVYDAWYERYKNAGIPILFFHYDSKFLRLSIELEKGDWDMEYLKDLAYEVLERHLGDKAEAAR